MRIGVVTVYDSSNYGAFLQAYSMRNVLETMGHEVFFVKFRENKARKKLCFGKPTSAKAILNYLLDFSHNYEKYNKLCKDISLLSEIDLAIANEKNLDCILMGSDEIWNVTVPTFKNPIFYGDSILVKKKYAYAVSMGCANDSDFKNFPEIVAAMKSVQIIGVRDKNTQSCLKKLGGPEAAIVCDPTCLLDSRVLHNFPSSVVMKRSYILVYSYFVPKKIRHHLRRFANEHALQLVSVCMHHLWCDKSVNCSALEFFDIIKNANYVYTSTFHGSIFTFMNHKKCLILAKSAKLFDFVKRVEMEEVLIKDSIDYEEFKKQLLSSPDYDHYDTQILKFRTESIRRIEQQLGGE